MNAIKWSITNIMLWKVRDDVQLSLSARFIDWSSDDRWNIQIGDIRVHQV